MANEDVVDVVVIGGGLGGLACALATAKRGLRVSLLEASGRLGGRGASELVDGFSLNQGPHALFEPSRVMLASLGVRPAARVAAPDGLCIDDGERLHAMPGGVSTFFGTSYLDGRDRLSLGGLLPVLLAARSSESCTFADWLDARALTPHVRALVEMFARVATYGAEPSHAAADTVLAQVRAAVIAGVRYVDGGWGSIVEALATAAREAGVRIALRERVSALELTPRGVRVQREDGSTLEARDVVIAGPSTLATTLLGPLGDAPSIAAAGPALRIACLDVGLDELPPGAVKGTFGTVEHTYVVVHSATARVAPEGGALVHAALYLGARAPQPKEDRTLIEAALERAIPGWRQHVVVERSAPAALATSARVDAPRGLGGRPQVRVASLSDDARGVYLVGDWVGARGLFLDGVLASALEAARQITTAREKAGRRASSREGASLAPSGGSLG